MLDILEAFLDHRKLSYVRVDESFAPEERQVQSPLDRTSRVVLSIASKYSNIIIPIQICDTGPFIGTVKSVYIPYQNTEDGIKEEMS